MSAMTITGRRPSLCHVFYGFGMGGAEHQLVQVINATGGEFHHTILALNGDVASRAHLDDPAAVRFAAAPPGMGGHTYCAQLARWLRHESLDLVLSYGWAGVDAILGARLAGRRRIVHAEHGFSGPELQGQLPRRLWMRRAFYRLTSTVVVPSETLYRIAREEWWLAADRVRLLPSSVDTRRFPPTTPADRTNARRVLGIAPEAVVIGTVTRLAPVKSLGLLLESFAALPNADRTQLLLVGDGPERAHLEREAARLGIAGRTTFAGEVEVPLTYYRCMDVFAMSSLSEQRSLALLEAMSCGLPVAVTDVGDLRAMLPPESHSLVVRRGDRAGLTQALATLLSDVDRRHALGIANAAFCRRYFDSAATVRQYRDLYLAALSA